MPVSSGGLCFSDVPTGGNPTHWPACDSVLRIASRMAATVGRSVGSADGYAKTTSSRRSRTKSPPSWQHVLSRVGRLHAVAPEHAAEVTPQHPRPEEREPPGPLQPERAVARELRVAHDRHVPGVPRQVARQDFRPRLGDDEDGASRGRELVAGGIHLAEVGVARDSGEVAEEDEQKELAIEKRREPDGSPVRPQEGEVGGGVAGGHFLTFFRWKVTGASSSRCLPGLSRTNRRTSRPELTCPSGANADMSPSLDVRPFSSIRVMSLNDRDVFLERPRLRSAPSEVPSYHDHGDLLARDCDDQPIRCLLAGEERFRARCPPGPSAAVFGA